MSKFNEDEYRNNQQKKHLEEDESQNSNCCNAEIYIGDICSECSEHCVTVTEEHENAMWDKGDAERELARESD